MRGYQPPFLELPGVPGNDQVRWVGSTMMDSEQYHVEEWHVRYRYTIERGGQQVELECWAPTFTGLKEYAVVTERRRTEARMRAIARADEDESWRAAVDAYGAVTE